jgi:hypothetical protein
MGCPMATRGIKFPELETWNVDNFSRNHPSWERSPLSCGHSSLPFIIMLRLPPNNLCADSYWYISTPAAMSGLSSNWSLRRTVSSHHGDTCDAFTQSPKDPCPWHVRWQAKCQIWRRRDSKMNELGRLCHHIVMHPAAPVVSSSATRAYLMGTVIRC